MGKILKILERNSKNERRQSRKQNDRAWERR